MAHYPSAGIFQRFLADLMERASKVPGSRHGSAVQDLVLCIELSILFLVWLRESPRVTLRSRPLFAIYGVNLLGAAMWCGLGVYMHLLEPLPAERTPTWLAFLALGAVTPILFPLVAFVAFAKDIPTPTNIPGPYLAAAFTGFAYMWAAGTGADLSLGGVMPKEIKLTPWHSVDGRSYAAVEGVHFDLLSSYPCYRGDSMFVLSTVFLLANALSIFLFHRATRNGKASVSAIAWRLRLGTSVMFINSVSILYLLVVFGMGVDGVFDVFHAIQGLVMGASFFSLRDALRIQMQDSKVA